MNKDLKNRLILGGICGAMLLVGGVASQYPMSAKKAYEKYQSFNDIEEGFEWLNKEFDGKGLFGKKEIEVFGEVAEMEMHRIAEDMINAFTVFE